MYTIINNTNIDNLGFTPSDFFNLSTQAFKFKNWNIKEGTTTINSTNYLFLSTMLPEFQKRSKTLTGSI